MGLKKLSHHELKIIREISNSPTHRFKVKHEKIKRNKGLRVKSEIQIH